MRPKSLNKVTIHTIWRAVDSAFRCVCCEGGERPDSSVTLARYLLDYGFDIPETITYCLAENETFSLKYRVFGANIDVFIHFYTD